MDGVRGARERMVACELAQTEATGTLVKALAFRDGVRHARSVVGAATRTNTLTAMPALVALDREMLIANQRVDDAMASLAVVTDAFFDAQEQYTRAQHEAMVRLGLAGKVGQA